MFISISKLLLHLLSVAGVSGSTVLLNKRDVSASQYDELVFYFKYASSAYTKNCPSPNGGKHLIKSFSDSATDVQGFIARDDSRKQFVVALRGSPDLTYATSAGNVKLTPIVLKGGKQLSSVVTVHTGFLKAWNSVAETVQNTIKGQLAIKTYANYSIVTTGHAIGGALASLAAVALGGIYYDKKFVYMYTYGQPRTGNEEYGYVVGSVCGWNFNQNYTQFRAFRATHTYDGLPNIIPYSSDIGPIKGYYHHDFEYWQNPDPSTANNTQLCQEGPEDPFCSASIYGPGVNKASHTYFGIPYEQAFCS